MNPHYLPERFFCHAFTSANEYSLNLLTNTFLNRISGEYVRIELKQCHILGETNVGSGQVVYYTAELRIPYGAINMTSSTSSPILHLIAGQSGGNKELVYTYYSSGNKNVNVILPKSMLLNNGGRLTINIDNIRFFGAEGITTTVRSFAVIVEVSAIEPISLPPPQPVLRRKH